MTALTPHQWLWKAERLGGVVFGILHHGLSEVDLDESLAPNLYAAVQNFRTTALPLWQALETPVIKYDIEVNGETVWGCE